MPIGELKKAVKPFYMYIVRHTCSLNIFADVTNLGSVFDITNVASGFTKNSVRENVSLAGLRTSLWKRSYGEKVHEGCRLRAS